MNTKILATLSLLLTVSTLLFLALLIADMAASGPLDTFELALEHAATGSPLLFLAYANVTLMTIGVVMWMGGLYRYCKPFAPTWAAMAAGLVPIYGVLNLFAYFSQITVVPRLLELHGRPDTRAMAEFWLRQMLQSWPDSMVAIFNNTAYGILGIPSIVFGLILVRQGLRAGGLLLALNGAACILGVIGIVARSELLSLGSMVGAVFFLFALIALAIGFWAQGERKENRV